MTALEPAEIAVDSERGTQHDDLLRLGVEFAPTGLVVLDPAGQILYANEEASRLLGGPSATIAGRALPELVVPRGARPLPPLPSRGSQIGWEVLASAQAAGAVALDITLRGTPGAIVAAIGTPPSSRPDDRFQAAVESAPSGMILVDESGRIVLVNREAERLFGWTRDEIVGRTIEDLVPERFRGRHPGQRAAFMSAPSARPMGAGRELFGLRKDGSEIPVEIGLNPLRTEEGVFILSSVVDVTARREAELRLKESEERFRLLVDGVQDYAVLMLDPVGNVASWNVGAERILGYKAEEMLGRHVTSFYPQASSGEGVLARALGQGRAKEEGTCLRKDGTRLVAETIVTALTSPGGGLRGFAQILRDVTNQRALEERLQQSQKMEAMGTLAGGIAHDFNNVLAGIVGYTELAVSALADRPDIQADLERVIKAAERGRELIKRILTFSRGEERELKPLRLQAVVHETLALLRSSLPASIEIREHLDPRTPPVRADATQLQQVIMNLATNAAAAMGEAGGVFEVALAPVRIDEVMAMAHPDLQPGLHVRLTVSDTGAGMTPELQSRIFEPFFTTKPRGSGTGLGLSIVHGIVRSHRGAIVVHSSPGAGTTFRVYLRASSQDHEEEPKPQPVAPAPQRAHVLYCEDEELLAGLAERQIRGLGYRVTVHTSSLEALEDFRSRPKEFDVVVTDNTMPHMTGLQLAQEMLRIRPELPIIMVSGIAMSLNQDVIRAKGLRHLLPKPHRREELARLLEEVTRRDDAGGETMPS